MFQPFAHLWDFIVQASAHLTLAELILRTLLFCCSMFAAVQLLSMLATHYGDHNATSKSLFLSVLLHFCFCLGWATVSESYPRAPGPIGEPEEADVRVTLSSEDGASTEEGNTREAWNSDSTSMPANTQSMR